RDESGAPEHEPPAVGRKVGGGPPAAVGCRPGGRAGAGPPAAHARPAPTHRAPARRPRARGALAAGGTAGGLAAGARRAGGGAGEVELGGRVEAPGPAQPLEPARVDVDPELLATDARGVVGELDALPLEARLSAQEQEHPSPAARVQHALARGIAAHGREIA